MNIPIFNAEQQYSSVRSRIPPRAPSPVKVLSNLFGNASSSRVDLLLPSRPALGTRNRELSRAESPTKVGSLLRTWSKHRSEENQPLRAAMNRSMSTILRPRSQDRPAVIDVYEPQLQPLREVSLNRVKRRSSLSHLSTTTEEVVLGAKNTTTEPVRVELQRVATSTVTIPDEARSEPPKGNQRQDATTQISAELQGQLDIILKELNTLPLHTFQPNLLMDSSLGSASRSSHDDIKSTVTSIQSKVEFLKGRIGDVFRDLGEQSNSDKERLRQLEQENTFLTAQVVAQKSAFRDIISKQRTRPEVDIWHRGP